MSDDPIPTPNMQELLLYQLRERWAAQVADLVNKAKLPPLIVATMLLDFAIALALSMRIPPASIAASLRAHAAKLEEPEETVPRESWN